MGMTIAQKIIAAHAGMDRVEPGDLVNVKLDVALGNDITAPIAIKEFEAVGATRVHSPDQVVLVLDHFVPNKDIPSAIQCQMVRRFARKHNIKHFYDGGEAGIEHALLPEQGLVVPGDAIIGADSHTVTYGALGAFSTGVGSTDLAAAFISGEAWFRVPETIRIEYKGTLKPWVGGKDLILYTIGQIGVRGALYQALEFTGRFTMCNMAIEAGGKAGIVPPDEVTKEFVAGRARREPVYYHSDPDARYSAEYSWDVSALEPQVSAPHLPENAKAVSEYQDVKIDQAVVGSCTNGFLDDLRVAARVLEGRKVHRDVRLIVIPATPTIYRQALDEGLFEIFLDAGANISTPTCGPCLGGYMGILAPGERCVSTTNRNFVGRMGHPESEVYLSGPAVAAASAVAGIIRGPEGL